MLPTTGSDNEKGNPVRALTLSATDARADAFLTIAM